MVKNGMLQKQNHKQALAAFAVGALLGLAFFLIVFTPATLDVTYDSWIYRGYIEGDIIQHYTGWLYYRNAPWTFPPLVMENVSAPLGTSIAFTDSVPIVALVCKVLSPLLPETFQYFGWVNLMNCMLQGGFAMLLVKRFNPSWVLGTIGTLLFLLNPIFVERLFRHTALGAQWMVLAALWAYFEGRRADPASFQLKLGAVPKDKRRFPVVCFALLAGLIPLVHSYFLPMVYALLLAALVEYGVRNKQAVRPALFLMFCFVLTLGSAVVAALHRGADIGNTAGYGSYSMNLNALFQPASFDYFAENGLLSWSRILPNLPQFYHQYDGFNYLGAGVLLGLACMLVYALVRAVQALRNKDGAFFKKAKAFAWEHGALIGVCFCLSIFAFSNIVCWGETQLFSVPLPAIVQRLANTFRSSGRLFWPCNYLLLLSLVVFLFQKAKARKAGAVALALVLALQVFDVSATLADKHAYFAAHPTEDANEFTSEGWVWLTQNHDEVLCLGNLFDYSLAAGIVRYNPNVQTNILVANRGNFRVIIYSYEDMIEALHDGQEVPEGTMYLCSDEETARYILEGLHPDAAVYSTGDFYTVARANTACPVSPMI